MKQVGGICTWQWFSLFKRRTYVCKIYNLGSYVTVGTYGTKPKCIYIVFQKYAVLTLAAGLVEVTWVILTKKVINILFIAWRTDRNIISFTTL